MTGYAREILRGYYAMTDRRANFKPRDWRRCERCGQKVYQWEHIGPLVFCGACAKIAKVVAR